MKRAVLLTLLVALGLPLACSDEVIVLASFPDADDAGYSPRHTSRSCVDNDDCTSNDFCNFERTDPVPSGRCVHRPFFCGDEKVHPVCGMDGITYVNDCYRRQAGVSSKTDGECPSETALPCDLTKRCPIGATCELLGGNPPGDPACGPPSGHCWGVIDRACDESDDVGQRWDECSTAPNALRCVSSCKAIMSGRAFTRAAPGCHEE